MLPARTAASNAQVLLSAAFARLLCGSCRQALASATILSATFQTAQAAKFAPSLIAQYAAISPLASPAISALSLTLPANARLPSVEMRSSKASKYVTTAIQLMGMGAAAYVW